MGNKMITLTQDNEIKLTNVRAQDPSFNFSRWVQEAWADDQELLTEEEIEQKIKISQMRADEELLRIEHLTKMIPLVQEKAAQQEKAREARAPEAVSTIKRILNKDGEERAKEVAGVWSAMVDIPADELLEMAKKKEVKEAKPTIEISNKPKDEDPERLLL